MTVLGYGNLEWNALKTLRQKVLLQLSLNLKHDKMRFDTLKEKV